VIIDLVNYIDTIGTMKGDCPMTSRKTSAYPKIDLITCKPAGMSAVSARGQPPQTWLAVVNVARLVEMMQEWRDRSRQRRHLASMDHHMLRDIGLSLADVERETHKPFWRP
jgi:uncharacterized protein YjiS (DUF1127 family)